MEGGPTPVTTPPGRSKELARGLMISRRRGGCRRQECREEEVIIDPQKRSRFVLFIGPIGPFVIVVSPNGLCFL